MSSKLVVILGALLSVGIAFGTTEDLSSQLQSLTAAVEEVGYDVDDLEDEVEGVGEGLGAQLGTLGVEIRSLRATLQAGLQDVERKVVSRMSRLVETAIANMETSLQTDRNSTLYLLQEIREQLVQSRKEVGVAVQYLPTSCAEIAAVGPVQPSGYYWVHGGTGSPVYVYCDMARDGCGCGSSRVWMRVAHLDMADPSQQCPSGFRLRTSPKRMCERTSAPGCTSITFPAHGVQYSRVCGRVRGYVYASADGIGAHYTDNVRARTIDGAYVDGVSITHGQSPREHIWTFAAFGSMPTQTQCNCFWNAIPFTGNDYFCDSGNYGSPWSFVLNINSIWDGEGCGPTSQYPCCQFNSPPWFCKELPHTTTDSIEVRVCSDQELTDEDTPIDLIELYVQ